MKNLILALMILVCSTGYAQKISYKGLPSAIWPKLYNITYQKGDDYDKPLFTKEVKELANKVVVLPGYMVPFENGMKGNHFILTSLPLNACFFCGVGGPETVIEVYLKTSVTYTDKPIEIKGKLILNDKDPDKMVYILEEAEFLGAIDF
jgi:hypothetical protein